MKTNQQRQDEEVAALMRMAHSPVHNYAIPGLTSYLIGGRGPQGCVRLFVNKRQHVEPITPHSHRFDFHARVLRGSVTNRLWTKVHRPAHGADEGDMYMLSAQTCKGSEPGAGYETVQLGAALYAYKDHLFEAGDTYSMNASEIHSIYFSRGAVVQFFEGPTTKDATVVLEPYVHHEVIPTLKVEKWMFRRGEAA